MESKIKVLVQSVARAATSVLGEVSDGNSSAAQALSKVLY